MAVTLKLNNKAAEIFNKSKQTNLDLQYLNVPEKIDFLEDVYKIRLTLTQGDLKKATEADPDHH